MHVNRVHAAVQSDRAKEHVRELQRVPQPFRSARDRGAEKKLLSHLLSIHVYTRARRQLIPYHFFVLTTNLQHSDSHQYIELHEMPSVCLA